MAPPAKPLLHGGDRPLIPAFSAEMAHHRQDLLQKDPTTVGVAATDVKVKLEKALNGRNALYGLPVARLVTTMHSRGGDTLLRHRRPSRLSAMR